MSRTRNSIRVIIIGALLCLSVYIIPAVQQQRQLPPISLDMVKGNIYEIKGEVARNGFIVTEEEVIAIDAKMTPKAAQESIAAIKEITEKPIKRMILTHSDGDHVNGLTGWPEGIQVIAHSNSRKHMEAVFKEPSHQAYLPRMVFTKNLTIFSGKTEIRLLHFGPAHTDGDVVVFLPAEKVAFLGDLVFVDRDPLIHKHKNGHSFGLAKVLHAILELDVDTFVHGHGDIIGRPELSHFLEELEKRQAAVKTLIQEGKSLDEIKKIYDIQEGRRPSLVEIIYTELTEKE